ncbi:MAG: hypothetical protein FJ388_10850 [Verrucomicrobia bacterium]|nr:hypothetical protein [Verrucomicrobiota bacterium]
MKRILGLTTTSLAVVALLTGCASPKTKTTVRVSQMLDANRQSAGNGKTADTKARAGVDTCVWAGLREAKDRRGGLPAPLAESSLIRKLINANCSAFERNRSSDARKDVPVRAVKFTPRDFQRFVDEAIPQLGVSAWAGSGEANVSTKRGADKRDDLLQQYLVVYFQGKFVDRAGRAVAKPAVNDGAVGNDTITGFATVILEAINDAFFDVPVYYEKKADDMRWLTPTGREPTYARLARKDDGSYDTARVVDVATVTDITTMELEAIQFLAGVASEESKAISGLVFRFLGGGEMSLIVGGHLSVGNNETLAKLVDTFFEVTSYRTTETMTYEYFKERNEGNYGAGLERLMELLKKVRELYKDDK